MLTHKEMRAKVRAEIKLGKVTKQSVTGDAYVRAIRRLRIDDVTLTLRWVLAEVLKP